MDNVILLRISSQQPQNSLVCYIIVAYASIFRQGIMVIFYK